MGEMNLPDWVWDYGTPVEYLESTRFQYINLGMKGNQYTSALFVASSGASSEGLFGARRGNAIADLRIGVTSANRIMAATGNYSEYTWDSWDGYQDRKTIIVLTANEQGQSWIVDGYELFTHQNAYETPKNLLLFAFDAYSSIIKGAWKVYRADVNNGAQQLALIPLIDKSNRPCMFDLISKQYFYNQGGGEFLYGGIISKSSLSPQWLLRKKAAIISNKKIIKL